MTSQTKASYSDGTTIGALRSLAANGLPQDQNLNVISLDALRSSLGDRWTAKQEQIWNQVERFLRHELRPEDLILRLDEVSVLVVQPGRTRFTAQTICVRVAGDLMRFFLGEVTGNAIVVKTVDAIQDGEVTCSPLPRPQLEAALMSRSPALWAIEARCRMPILTRLGRDLVVDLCLAPILALQRARTDAAFAVETVLTDAATGTPLGTEERSQLQSADIASVDLKVLTAAFARRREIAQNTSPLVIPVSSTTLAHSSARYALLQEVHKLGPQERQSFVWEIVDLEAGVPAGRVADLVAIAKPHCRGVICRLEPSGANADKLKNAGATLSIQGQLDTQLTEYGLLKQEQAFASVLKRLHAVTVHKLPPELLPVAAFLGVTHCTVADAQPETVRFTVRSALS